MGSAPDPGAVFRALAEDIGPSVPKSSIDPDAAGAAADRRRQGGSYRLPSQPSTSRATRAVFTAAPSGVGCAMVSA